MADPFDALLRTLGLKDDPKPRRKPKKKKQRVRWGKTEIIRSYGPGKFESLRPEQGKGEHRLPKPIPMASRKPKRAKSGRGRKRTA